MPHSIAFVNTGRYKNYRNEFYFSEPVHLLAMHNLCKSAGHRSKIFQLHDPNLSASLDAIESFAPDLLALSLLQPEKDEIEAIDALLDRIQGQGSQLMLGGPEMSLDANFYAQRLHTKWPGSWRSVVVVDGPGEALLRVLAQCDFSLENSETQKKLAQEGISASKQNKVWFVKGCKPLPLSQQNHTRDYSLTSFEGKACVKWSTGCWATCQFCYNLPQRSDYKAPELAAAEIQHLLTLGVRSIDVASPQFTANPNQASALIGALPKETPPLSFTSRIDSFWHAIHKHPTVWKTFANANRHRIDFGIESFLPDRLVRMRKFHKKVQAERQNQQIEDVLQFFQGTRTKIAFYLIPLDWQMDLKEALEETERTFDLLNRYPDTLVISAENVGKLLSYSAGSPYAKTMQPFDFLRFEREPKLLLLQVSADLFCQKMEPIAATLDAPGNLMEEVLTYTLLTFYRKLVLLLIDLNPEDFSLEPLFQVMRNPFAIEDLLQRLLAKVGKPSQKRLENFFAKEEVTLSRKLSKGIDDLITAKAKARLQWTTPPREQGFLHWLTNW